MSNTNEIPLERILQVAENIDYGLHKIIRDETGVPQRVLDPTRVEEMRQTIERVEQIKLEDPKLVEDLRELYRNSPDFQ